MSVVIAIDGPAGSGKSTLGRGLAAALDLPYVNTGLMYRSLTAHVLDAGVDPEDEGNVDTQLAALRFELTEGSPPELDVETAPLPVTSPEVERNVSAVSRHPSVRQRMATMQRALGADGAVMEGRDISSVIFPDALVKVFLDADPAVRVDRRVLEREPADSTALAEDLTRRDALDAKTNPPVPQPDALVVDTSSVDADAVLAMVLAVARERMS